MGLRIPTRQCAALMAIGTLALGAALSPSAAVAAFPGGNGVIAYEPYPFQDPNQATGILSIRPDGSGLRQLTSSDPPFVTDRRPSWSADGRRLVFSREFYGDIGGSSAELLTVNADGSRATEVHGGFTSYDSPSFSPNGRRIVFGGVYTVRTGGDSAKPDKLVSMTVADRPEYSPDGRRIVFSGIKGDLLGEARSGIWIMRRDGSRLRQLTSVAHGSTPHLPADTLPDFSPDGSHIAFVHFDESDEAELHMMRADGSDEHAVPNTDGAGGPAYAPAGDRIALSLPSNGGGDACRDIYTISPTGSDRQRVTEGCEVAYSYSAPSWQPDPPSTLIFGKVKKNKKRGTAKFAVEVFGPGELELAKNGKLNGKQESAASEGTVKLPIEPRRRAKKQLRRKGKVNVRAKVTYTPDGGPPNTQSKKVGLKKKR
jgi:TolB protein